jgi:two-component system sensor histidine kinase TctE
MPLTEANEGATEAPRVSQSAYIRTTFLEALAHELRGPSGVTLGALDELELSLGDRAKEFATLFAMARRGIRRVLRSADRLSRTAQLEGNPQVLSLEESDLLQLVDRSVKEAELVEARRGVKVEVKLPEGKALARVDPAWLGAAVSELVGSALRSARRSVMVELQQTGDSYRFVVCDDGVSSAIPRLRRFEPSEDRRDAGLAFPLVKEVADAHHGELIIKGGESGGLVAVLSVPR